MEILQLCDLVRETSFSIHSFLKNGHLERVYENALISRLKRQSIDVQQQVRYSVFDEDGTRLGKFIADLQIDGRLIVELKVCTTLADHHLAQLFGYLRGARLRHGMLINFGAPRLQVRKVIL